MLVMRLQRVGRSGISHFRVIVQEKRFSPVSGKILASIGTYDPHTKQATLDKEAVKKYLADGAQPSDRLKLIFKAEKISLPSWVPAPHKRNKAPKKVAEPEKKVEPAAEVTPADQGEQVEQVEQEEKVEQVQPVAETDKIEEGAPPETEALPAVEPVETAAEKPEVEAEKTT